MYLLKYDLMILQCQFWFHCQIMGCGAGSLLQISDRSHRTCVQCLLQSWWPVSRYRVLWSERNDMERRCKNIFIWSPIDFNNIVWFSAPETNTRRLSLVYLLCFIICGHMSLIDLLVICGISGLNTVFSFIDLFVDRNDYSIIYHFQ